MVYTLGQAAKAVGKSKATISKAIKSGRISASKSDKGVYSIDPSELHRVYPMVTQLPVEGERVNTNEVRELELLLEAANQRLSDKEEQLSDLKEDRDKWRQQAQGLLTDQRPAGFLKRLFGN